MSIDPTDSGGKSDRALLKAHVLMMASEAGVAGGRYSALDREAVQWLVETRDDLLVTCGALANACEELLDAVAGTHDETRTAARAVLTVAWAVIDRVESGHA